jgi:hypothetical protein
MAALRKYSQETDQDGIFLCMTTRVLCNHPEEKIAEKATAKSI